MITKKLAELVAENVEKILSGTTCKVITPERNNGVRKLGIAIKKNGDSLCKSIYIDNLKYTEIDKIVAKVIFKYLNDNGEEEEEVRTFKKNLNAHTILENVVFRLVNADLNKSFLAKAPHINILDMAAIYILPVKSEKTGMELSARITESLVEHFSISEHDLYEAALRNSKGYYKFSIRTVAQTLEEMRMPVIPEAFEIPLHVCTGANQMNGSTIMLFPECFKGLADSYRSDLYIVPSSIHECLAIPKLFTDDLESLKHLCRAVNIVSVPLEDWLGDTIYKYNRFKNEIEIACK